MGSWKYIFGVQYADLSFLIKEEVQVESRSVVSLMARAKLLPP